MTKYYAIEDNGRALHNTWTIDRITISEGKVRLPFRGTKAEAEAETVRLNKLAGLSDQEATLGLNSHR